MNRLIDLNGKNVIVTGGGRGICKSIVEKFLDLESNVVSVSLDFAGLAGDEPKGSKKPGRLYALAGDAAREETARYAVAETLTRFGPPDVLVNNVGFWQNSPVEQMGLEQWNEMLRINLTSAFLFTRAVVPYMKEKRGGSIINISSISGLRGNADMTAYNAAKFGVIGFTKGLAQELAPHRIRVNAICPGDVNTDMFMGWVESFALAKKIPADQVIGSICEDIPLGRVAAPEEIADVALFLASSLSSYVTGAAVPVTGGKYGL